MRNFSLLLLLVTAISLSSCKKDSNPDKKDTEAIIGKWYLKSVSEKSFKNGKLESEDSYSVDHNNYFREFRSNGTGVDGDGDEYTYKVASSKLTTRYKGEDEDIIEDIRTINSNDLVVYGEDIHPNGNDVYKYTYEETYLKK